MKLKELIQLEDTENVEVANILEVDISSIAADSRKVTAGSLYFCILGAKYDGRVFIGDAINRGAVAIVYDGEPYQPAGGIAIRVKDVRRALSYAAHKFYGEPSKRLRNIAITGTSGKTSVAWILGHALRRLGEPTFMGGTLAFKVLDENDATSPNLKELSNTTMDPISVHAFLNEAVLSGARASVFEATSQGVVQSRMRDVAWDGAIFTNLSRDHLDLHGTMERYEAAKCKLFTEDLAESTKEKKFAVFNFDDPAARRIGYEIKSTKPHIKVVSVATDHTNSADFHITNLASGASGISFDLNSHSPSLHITAPLVGLHNAYNLALAAITLQMLGYSAQQIGSVIAESPPVPGRLERVVAKDRNIFVDYAHKPDALEKVLQFLKPICKGRLICIMGCGGDRDQGKRPVMGEIARRLADVTVVTSDNPRSEDPQSIINQILEGIHVGTGYPLVVEPDRRLAIEKAIKMSTPDDIVLIAGKGHEPYQEIHGVKHPFHDAHIAKLLLDRGN